MQQKRLCALVISLIFVFSMMIGGCAPSKKPLLPNPAPVPTKNNVIPTRTNANAKADKIAREVDKVAGVKKCTVVVSGRTAYLGIDLAANIDKSKTKAVENAATTKCKKADSTIKTVLVTSDVDTVIRLKKIYNGITVGKPISSFTRELGEIGRRISPKIKT